MIERKRRLKGMCEKREVKAYAVDLAKEIFVETMKGRAGELARLLDANRNATIQDDDKGLSIKMVQQEIDTTAEICILSAVAFVENAQRFRNRLRKETKENEA